MKTLVKDGIEAKFADNVAENLLKHGWSEKKPKPTKPTEPNNSTSNDTTK